MVNFKETLMHTIKLFYAKYGFGCTTLSPLQAITSAIVSAGIFILLVEKYTRILIPSWALVLFVPINISVITYIGHLNEKKGWLNALNEYTTREVNPFNRKIEKSLDDLYEILGTKKERRT